MSDGILLYHWSWLANEVSDDEGEEGGRVGERKRGGGDDTHSLNIPRVLIKNNITTHTTIAATAICQKHGMLENILECE